MAQHMRNGDDRLGGNAKQASLLASAHAAERRARAESVSDPGSRASDGKTGDPREFKGRRSQHAERQTEARRGGRAEHAPRTECGSVSQRDRMRKPNQSSLGSFARRNIAYILSVVAVVVIATLMLVFIRGCDSDKSSASVSETGSLKVGVSASAGPPDWSNLDYADGRYAYIVDGQVKSRLGIDVSENQYEIDWQAVAADGIDFAMIRLGYRGATEGDIYLDEYYQANLAGAQAAGIDCGVYFFSQAQTLEEAVEEADFVIESLDGAQLQYPIAFDSEEAVLNLEESRTTGLSDTAMTVIAQAFCARVEQYGYRSIVYGNAVDLSRYYHESMPGHGFWWAEYDVPIPSTSLDIAMWQYSPDGVVAGVEGNVDMNIDLSNI